MPPPLLLAPCRLHAAHHDSPAQCLYSDGPWLSLCQQVALWAILCVGYALPLLLQYAAQAAALQAFVRR